MTAVRESIGSKDELISNFESLRNMISRYSSLSLSEVSVHAVASDYLLLSGAGFCLINLLTPEREQLKTIAFAKGGGDEVDKTKSTFYGELWEPGSFVHESMNLNQTSKNSLSALKRSKSVDEKIIRFSEGLDVESLWCFPLSMEETLFGCVVLGFEQGSYPVCEENIEFFHKFVGKELAKSDLQNKLQAEHFGKRTISHMMNPDLIFLLDSENKIVASSLYRSGTTNEKLRNMNIMEFVPLEFGNVLKKSISEAVLNMETTFEKLPLILPESSQRFYFIKIIPFSVNGSVNQVFIQASDYSHQKHLLKDFTDLQKLARIGWWELIVPQNQLTWSEGLYELIELEYTEKPPKDDLYMNCIHSDDLEHVKKVFLKAIRELSNYEVTYRLKMKDGRTKWVVERCINFFDSKGILIRSLGVIQDITDLKSIESELENSNSRLKKVTDQLPGVVFEYEISASQSRKYNYISEKVKERSGVSREELELDATQIWKNINEEDLKGLKQVFYLSAQTLEPFSFSYRINLPENNGIEMWQRLEATPERLANGSTRWYGYSTNIDDQKKLEIKLKDSENIAHERGEFLKQLTNQVPGTILEYQVYKNGKSKCNFASDKVENNSGIKVMELIENADLIWKKVYKEDLPELKSKFCYTDQIPSVVKMDYRAWDHDNKNILWKHVEAEPVRMEDGSIKWYAYISDINDKKASEEKLILAEKKANITSASLTKLTNQVPGIIFELQLTASGQMKFNHVSSKIEFGTGIGVEQLKKEGSGLFDIIHEDDRDLFRQLFYVTAERLNL